VQNSVNIGLRLDGSQARIVSFTFKDYVRDGLTG